MRILILTLLMIVCQQTIAQTTRPSSNNKIITNQGTVYYGIKDFEKIINDIYNQDKNNRPFISLNIQDSSIENLRKLNLKQIDCILVYNKKSAFSTKGSKGNNGYVAVFTDGFEQKMMADASSPRGPNDFSKLDTTVYSEKSVNVLPSFSRKETFSQFILRNVQYPIQTKNKGIKGVAKLAFKISFDGVLSDVKIDKKIGNGIDEAIIKVAKTSRRWNPGFLNNKPVNVRCIELIEFDIDKKFIEDSIKQQQKVQSLIDENNLGLSVPSASSYSAEGPKKSVVTDDNKIYNFVSMETPPTYPGGIEKLNSFISDNLRYPEIAKSKKVQGTVLLSFVIEKDGSLTDIKVDKSCGSGLDEEAIRVIKISRRWNPGVESGKTVRTRFVLPVKFKLD